MVATLILVQDKRGDMHDQEIHLRIAAGQRINAQGVAIPEFDSNAKGTTLTVDEYVRRTKTLADYNRPDQLYANRSTSRPPTIHKDFEFKVQYYTLVGQIPYLTSILWTIWRGSRI